MAQIHHSNIVLSEIDSREIVFDILKKDLNFNIQQNPDFLLLENDTFGIDDVRQLERWSLNKPFSGDIKVLILITNSITFEAQNALLKILEEPPIGTYFFINLKNLGNILPTLLSRVRILDFSKVTQDVVDFKNRGQEFLKNDFKHRIALIKNLAKSENKNDMKVLIQSLESLAYQYKMPANGLKNILVGKVMSATRGSSPKMLLEWLSCVV